ncbi:MAG: triacylglycerol lipase [Polyangia bacterium]
MKKLASPRRSPFNLSALAGLLALVTAGAGCGGDATNGTEPPAADTTPGAVIPATPPPSVKTCRAAPYPIVLAHGMAGFERIGPVNYFFNVAADLKGRGEAVFESQVSPYETSTVRAGQLAQFIDATLRTSGACKVNVIAHSQGGLDSRYAVSSLGYGDRIGALITVGTPHAGTPVADVALGLVPGFSADAVNLILLAVQGLTGNDQGRPDIRSNLSQLATATMKTWNEQNRDDPRVRYYSVAGRSNLARADTECKGGVWSNPAGLDVLNPLLALPVGVWTVTSPNPLVPIANDGLVPVTSARWGTFLGCVAADHFDEVGQIAELGPDLISGFYHLELYRKLVAQLHSDGL